MFKKFNNVMNNFHLFFSFSDAIIVSYSRLLAIWSQNVTLNACISSSAAAELLEDWSRVALVALEA